MEQIPKSDSAEPSSERTTGETSLFRSAAVKFRGKIFEGRTHSDAINKIPWNEYSLTDREQIYNELISKEMGYVTQGGFYVNRVEAAQLIRQQLKKSGKNVAAEDIAVESNVLNEFGRIGAINKKENQEQIVEGLGVEEKE